MSDTNNNDFAEIMNRIARVPASSIPPRKPQQSSNTNSDKEAPSKDDK